MRQRSLATGSENPAGEGRQRGVRVDGRRVLSGKAGRLNFFHQIPFFMCLDVAETLPTVPATFGIRLVFFENTLI